MSRLRLRIASVASVVLLIGYFAVANFVPAQTRLESPLLPDDGLRLGLDLQGGIHWVLGVNLDILNRTVSVGAPSTQWWTQLASAIAGGLSFATLLTLVLTPCLLVLGARLFKDRRETLPVASPDSA